MKIAIVAAIEWIADKINDRAFALASRWGIAPCMQCGDWTSSPYRVCYPCEPALDSEAQFSAIVVLLGERAPEAHVYEKSGLIYASIYEHNPITIAPNWNHKGQRDEGFVLFRSGGGDVYEGPWTEIVDRAELILRKELEEVMDDLSSHDFDFLKKEEEP